MFASHPALKQQIANELGEKFWYEGTLKAPRETEDGPRFDGFNAALLVAAQKIDAKAAPQAVVDNLTLIRAQDDVNRPAEATQRARRIFERLVSADNGNTLPHMVLKAMGMDNLLGFMELVGRPAPFSRKTEEHLKQVKKRAQ